MSVTTYLSYEIIANNLTLPISNATFEMCDQAGTTCYTGSGNISPSQSGLSATGTVNVQGRINVYAVRIKYGGAVLFEVINVNKVIDTPGNINVTVVEKWNIPQNLSLSLSGPSPVAWKVVDGGITFKYLGRGADLTNVSVDLIDANGNVITTASGKDVSISITTAAGNVIQEKVQFNAVYGQSVKMCSFKVRSNMVLLEAQAADPANCLDVYPSISIAVTGLVGMTT